MINRNNKKGFTIVELVIVIAVIAILAAVLIPTFSGIIAKANESADIKAVREMNTALTAEFAVEKPDEGDMEAVINALEKNGFNSLDSIKPISKDYKFVWSYVDCCIILLNADDEIVFPAAETLKFELNETNIENNNLSGGVKYVDAVVADKDALAQAFENGQMNITLESDIVMDSKVTVPAGANITLNLAGNDINASALSGRPFEMSNGATLVINAEDSDIKSGKYGLVNISNDVSASVTINGGNITGSLDNGSFIKIVGGNADKVSITLNNVNMTDNAEINTTSGKTSELNRIVNANAFAGELTINVVGGKYEALAGFTGGGSTSNFKFDGVTFTTEGLTTEIRGNGTFSKCTFNVGNTTVSTAPAAAVAVSGNGTATVTDSTITTDNVAYYVYSTGGSITATNCTVTGTVAAGTSDGTITVDGVKQ